MAVSRLRWTNICSFTIALFFAFAETGIRPCSKEPLWWKNSARSWARWPLLSISSVPVELQRVNVHINVSLVIIDSLIYLLRAFKAEGLHCSNGTVTIINSTNFAASRWHIYFLPVGLHLQTIRRPLSFLNEAHPLHLKLIFRTTSRFTVFDALNVW